MLEITWSRLYWKFLINRTVARHPDHSILKDNLQLKIYQFHKNPILYYKQHCNKTDGIPLFKHASISLKQTWFLNLTQCLSAYCTVLIKIYLPFYLLQIVKFIIRTFKFLVMLHVLLFKNYSLKILYYVCSYFPWKILTC